MMNEKHKKILVAFKRMGGRGHVADAQRAANVDAADGLMQQLIKLGFMEKPAWDDYHLTSPDGYVEANRLIREEGY